jgi:3-oxoacyl-[acyl-carrier-protein] synthase I
MSDEAHRGGPVYIAACGAATPLGCSAAASAAAIRAGVAGFSSHPVIIDSVGSSVSMARAPYLPVFTSCLERMVDLAEIALDEVLQPLGSARGRTDPPHVLLALPQPRPGLPDDLAEQITVRLGVSRHGRLGKVHVFAEGHAAGFSALEMAASAVAAGRVDLCVVGGVDSYVDPDTLAWLEHCDQLHGAGQRNNAWGFLPGEAACFFLVASQRGVNTFKLEPLLELSAVATGQEANRIKTDSVCTGVGLTNVFERVLESAKVNAGLIDDIICDMNGEPYRADEFGFTLARTAHYFAEPSAFSAPADCWGDVGAASAPLFVLLAAFAGRKRYAKGPATLLWASSEGGRRGAAVVRSHSPGGGLGRHD